MKNSLERLDYLINVRLNPISTIGIDASCRLLEIWINETTRECDLIRTHLLKKSVDIENEKTFVLLVHQCQAAVIRLLDKVFGYTLQHPSNEFNSMYHIILKRLELLLHFMEQHYPRYFNKDEKVPDHILATTRDLITKDLEYLEQTVFANIDLRLKKIIWYHLQKFLQSNNEDILCYKTLAYIKDLVSELRAIHLSSHCSSETLMDLLIYMNFNSMDLTNYYVDNMVCSTAQCNSPVLKRDLLLSALKNLNQLQQKPGVAYKPQVKNLKDQINAWISEEIHYIDKQQQACINTSYVHPAPTPDKIEREKLPTSLSVQQLAVFARAARDVGILTTKNQSELLKTFAKIFRTPQAEFISAESMRTKYYTPDPAAKESVKNLLMEMFKKIHSY